MYNMPAIVQAGTDTAIAIGGWSGWLLAALSLALGAGMLLVFGKTSNKEAMRAPGDVADSRFAAGLRHDENRAAGRHGGKEDRHWRRTGLHLRPARGIVRRNVPLSGGDAVLERLCGLGGSQSSAGGGALAG